MFKLLKKLARHSGYEVTNELGHTVVNSLNGFEVKLGIQTCYFIQWRARIVTFVHTLSFVPAMLSAHANELVSHLLSICDLLCKGQASRVLVCLFFSILVVKNT